MHNNLFTMFSLVCSEKCRKRLIFTSPQSANLGSYSKLKNINRVMCNNFYTKYLYFDVLTIEIILLNRLLQDFLKNSWQFRNVLNIHSDAPYDDNDEYLNNNVPSMNYARKL